MKILYLLLLFIQVLFIPGPVSAQLEIKKTLFFDDLKDPIPQYSLNNNKNIRWDNTESILLPIEKEWIDETKYNSGFKDSFPAAGEENKMTALFAIIFSALRVTWWLILLSMLIVGLVLHSLYRYRINQLLQLQIARRDRIARDLHDDIGSTLSNINMLSAITLKKLDRPGEAGQHLRRIGEEVSYCSQALDDIIWSANPKNDTLDETIARMRRYSAELFELSGNITCHLDMDEQFTIQKLQMEQRRDIYLIYKEALNNIYKHASASTVWITVKERNNSLDLMFKDNGKGFNIKQETHRNGLKNMKARVEKWRGKLTIHSEKQIGTQLLIILPVDRPNE